MNRTALCSICRQKSRRMVRVLRKATKDQPYDDPDYGIRICVNCDEV